MHVAYSLVSNNNKNGSKQKMEETKKSLLDDSFTSAMTLTNSGVPQVPDRYVLPPAQRPALGSSIGTRDDTTLPVIDLSLLHQPLLRSRAIHEINMACKEFGFFQVIVIYEVTKSVFTC